MVDNKMILTYDSHMMIMYNCHIIMYKSHIMMMYNCQCGLITKSDAERLCSHLLDKSPPR